LTACSGSKADTKATEDTTKTEEVATTNDSTAASSDSLTLKEGVLQVGVSVDYPPMEYYAEDGTTKQGFDIEVSQAIADELGVKLELVDTSWEGIFASLDSDRYDCVISAVSIDKDREAAYNLTKPYIASRIVLVTQKGAGITSPEQLAGKSVAVQTDTTSDYYLKDLITNGLDAESLPYDKMIQCFDDLKVGRVDAVLTDSVVAAYYMGSDADKFDTTWESDTAEPMAICLKKGNDALTQEIEKAIDTLYSNGKMAEISKKYFGKDITEGVR
jgi:polar amino acid transport system substrate-binding protein